MSDLSSHHEHAEHEAAANDPLISRRHEHNNEIDLGRPTSGPNLFSWTLTVVAGVSGLLFGYDTGVISSTLVSVGTDLSSRHLSTLDQGLITSSTSFFALIASPVAGYAADKIGRKNVILFADALFTFGALWQAFSSTVWSMILGRSIVGFAIGAASLIAPLYIAELAPGHLRGRLVTVSSLFITGGQVVAYLAGWLLSSVGGGWRWMVGLGAVPSITQLIMLFFMPETPRYLVRAGQEKKARIILGKVYGNTEGQSNLVKSVLTAINKEIAQEDETKNDVRSSNPRSFLPPTLQSLLFHTPHRRALTIACLLQGLQQCCGFNSLMYFSATIFAMLAFKAPTLTSLSVAVTNFLFTLVAFYAIDRVGRRRILLWTIPVMIIALVLCAISFTYIHFPKSSTSSLSLPLSTATQQANTSQSVARTPAICVLVSLVIYVASYATGLGNVPWQQSELFPLSVRSIGSAIATSTNWASNTVVALTFLPLMQAITPVWTFVLYAVICAAGWIALWCIYPETMGMDLEDVSAMFQGGWGVKGSRERLKMIGKDVQRSQGT